jgi:hypothetical protein
MSMVKAINFSLFGILFVREIQQQMAMAFVVILSLQAK